MPIGQRGSLSSVVSDATSMVMYRNPHDSTYSAVVEYALDMSSWSDGLPRTPTVSVCGLTLELECKSPSLRIEQRPERRSDADVHMISQLAYVAESRVA